MLRKIVETTDGKYLGLVFDTEKEFRSPDGILFTPTKIQDLGNGLIRYSNSNYVLLTKKINNG